MLPENLEMLRKDADVYKWCECINREENISGMALCHFLSENWGKYLGDGDFLELRYCPKDGFVYLISDSSEQRFWEIGKNQLLTQLPDECPVYIERKLCATHTASSPKQYPAARTIPWHLRSSR